MNNHPIFIHNRIKLSVGILVSNNIKYIRKVMEALKPLLEAVSSELIVIDTVGAENSDGSLDVAKEYTKKIYRFKWNNDFAEARNVSIQHSSGEWFLYIDDDEIFDDVKELIRFFNTDEHNRYFMGMFNVHNYMVGGGYRQTIATRLIRRTERTGFEGRIHEQFNEAFFPVKQFNCFLHHYGYFYENEEQRISKQKRNLELLENELKQKGPTARICAQIVGQLMGDYSEEACKRCNEYIKLLKGTGELDLAIGQWLLMSNVRFVASYGSLEGVMAIEEEMLGEFRLQETARLVLAYQVAAVAFNSENYKVASERIKEYLKNYDWLKAHPNEKIIQQQMDFVDFMKDETYFQIVKIGIITENNLQDFDQAYSYLSRLDFTVSKNDEELFQAIKECINGVKEEQKKKEFYKQIYREEFFENNELRRFLPFS